MPAWQRPSAAGHAAALLSGGTLVQAQAQALALAGAHVKLCDWITTSGERGERNAANGLLLLLLLLLGASWRPSGPEQGREMKGGAMSGELRNEETRATDTQAWRGGADRRTGTGPRDGSEMKEAAEELCTFFTQPQACVMEVRGTCLAGRKSKQSRAEQSRAKPSQAEQSRAEQQRFLCVAGGTDLHHSVEDPGEGVDRGEERVEEGEAGEHLRKGVGNKQKGGGGGIERWMSQCMLHSAGKMPSWEVSKLACLDTGSMELHVFHITSLCVMYCTSIICASCVAHHVFVRHVLYITSLCVMCCTSRLCASCVTHHVFVRHVLYITSLCVTCRKRE